mgnify:CR=1 FL=1
MKNILFKGSGVALVTPMDTYGNVNYSVLGELIEFQIQNKTDAIIICGTTGESATLSEEEQYKIIKYTVERVKNRIPVIAGTGSNNTISAVKKSKTAQDLGADGVLVVTPYYNKTSQRGIIEHYDLISKNIDIPIIVYNVPSRTGCCINPETYVELAKRPNIVAVKEASGNISAVAKTVALCKDELMVYSGNDDQIIPVLSLGGIGVISVIANICPEETHNIVAEYLRGNTSQSRELQLKFINLIEALFSDVNPIPVKEAMNLIGFPCGKCRLPLISMEEKLQEKLKICMRENSLLDY